MMATCWLSENQTPNRESAREHDPEFITNGSLQLPTVTVHDARNVSIGSNGSRVSSSSDNSPPSSASSSPNLPSSSTRDMIAAMELASREFSPSSSSGDNTGNNASLPLDLSSLDTDVSKMRDKFEDLSSNNNNLNFSCPTRDKLRFNRRSLVRTSSSACSSISEDMEYASDENEADLSSASSSSGGRPSLQRSSAIHRDVDQLSPRSISPISCVEELETYSGVKTVVRRAGKSQNGRTSPSWRWSVMGVANGDYDAVARATNKDKGNHHITSTPNGTNNNGHSVLSRRSSFGLSPATSTLISPRTKKLSTEFRRLSLQMDMPWRGLFKDSFFFSSSV